MIRPIDRKTTSKVVLIKLKKEFLKYEAKLKQITLYRCSP